MYKITIEEIRTVEEEVNGEWGVIGKEYKKGSFHENPYLEDVYGYRPSIIKKVTRTEKVYEQTVVYIDLTKVIKAINMIE